MKATAIDALVSAAAPPEPVLVSDAQLRRIGLIIVVGSFMAVMDQTTINVALADFSVMLGTEIASTQWIVTVYLLAVAAVIPVSGWLARHAGAKRVYVSGLAVFTLGSLASSQADSLATLIPFRALQGLGGGVVLPVGMMIMANQAGPLRMGRIFSLVGVPTVLAPAFGPAIGGVIVQVWGPSALFFMTVPVGLIGVAVALTWLPTVDLGAPGRLDAVGLVQLTIGVPLFTFGITQIGRTGHLDRAVVIAPVLLGAALIATFVARAHRVQRPLLDVKLFGNPVFAAAATVTFMLNFAILGSYLLMPLFFQGVWGETVAAAGLLIGPQGVGAAIGIFVSARLVDKGRGVPAIVAGTVIAAASSVALAFLRVDTPSWVGAAILFVRGCGLGAAMNPSLAVALGSLLPPQVSDATPQMNVAQRLGAAIGTAVFAVILTQSLAASPSSRPGLEHAFAVANGYAAAACVICIVPTLILLRISRTVTKE